MLYIFPNTKINERVFGFTNATNMRNTPLHKGVQLYVFKEKQLFIDY